MTFIIRQTTAVNIPMGPFIDPTARTAETGMTITQAETFLSKNGASQVAKSDTNSATELGNGMYSIALDTDDTTTVGTLAVYVNDSQASPMAVECQVIEEAIYDALYVLNADGFNSSGEVSLIAATQTQITNTLADTNELQGDWTDGGRLDALIDRLIVELDTARSEPSNVDIDHTWKLGEKTDYLLKLLGNKRDQTATLQQVYNSDESTVEHKAIIGSDGTTLTFGQMKQQP